MSKNYSIPIAQELSLKGRQVEAVLRLLEEGSTVPFIARYRKEATEGLDEVAITYIRDRRHQMEELDKRRVTVLKSIQDQGKLTDSLKEKILAVTNLTVLEDIYLPFRPKRRTRATVAKEKGLEPLAKILFAQEGVNPREEAKKYLSEEMKVLTVDEALAGGRDIIAEWVNEDAAARQRLRALFRESAVITSSVINGKEEEGIKYQDYFKWEESVKSAPSHRILAVRRAEKELFVTMRILPPEKEAIDILGKMFVKGRGEDSTQVWMAVEDSYKRLLSLSLETEIRLELKKRADQDAIEIFKSNLHELLMAAPLGQKNVLAMDPGYRTGCKVVCLDSQGKLLYSDVVYAADAPAQQQRAVSTIKDLCKQYKIQVIVIGNGTASRETEEFIRRIGLPSEIAIVVVNESGASIYSASDAAREEFPDQDVTVRGAVSIGRRLMDPLAELVKIDPKSIGVGQYQHDVDQNLLRAGLDDVVISCVNQVGVEVNTSSKQLLSYVSGLGPVRAQAIIEYRNQNGAFRSRGELLKVPGLGPKAYEQAAGFLRIRNGLNPLDASAVHPEAYPVVDIIALDMKCSMKDLLANEALLNKINFDKYVTDSIGMPTLLDIRSELAKPGRDPREPFQLFSFKEGIKSMDDIRSGMKLPGVVTNVTAFGAFVDIGVHNDGLVHISQISNRYVKDPHEILRVHQKVNVTVLEVDRERNRIALSLKTA